MRLGHIFSRLPPCRVCADRSADSYISSGEDYASWSATQHARAEWERQADWHQHAAVHQQASRGHGSPTSSGHGSPCSPANARLLEREAALRRLANVWALE